MRRPTVIGGVGNEVVRGPPSLREVRGFVAPQIQLLNQMRMRHADSLIRMP